MNRAAPAFLLSIVLLAACATGGSGGSPDPSGGGGGGEIEHPTAGDKPIVIVENVGGFVPVDFVATQTPVFVLLGDGRAIVQGAQELIYPGPALPPLLERTLTEEGIQEVLRAIQQTDLFDADLELRGAQNFVADASDTVFTVNAGGETVTVTVYGLGTLAPMPGAEQPPGVNEAEARAHAELQELHDRLLMLDTWLPASAFADQAWRPYEAEAYRLYVRDVTGEPVEGDVPVAVRDWPVDASGVPAAFGEEQELFGNGTRCGVVEGDEAQAWLEELSAANQLTQWKEGDRRFSVRPRPLLPHEERGCPELSGA